MGCTQSVEMPSIDDLPNDLTAISDPKLMISKAISSGNIEENVSKLVQSKVDLNHQLEHESVGSCYPIHLLVKSGNPKAVDLLIKGGADVDNQDSRGQTALHWAAEKGSNTEVMDVLIKAGADVNAVCNSRYTPLNYAAQENPNQEIITFLISNGADVDGRDNPPIACAAEHMHPETVLTLLANGSTTDGIRIPTKTGDFLDLLEWAKMMQWIMVIEELTRRLPPQKTDPPPNRETGDGAEQAPPPATDTGPVNEVDAEIIPNNVQGANPEINNSEVPLHEPDAEMIETAPRVASTKLDRQELPPLLNEQSTSEATKEQATTDAIQTAGENEK